MAEAPKVEGGQANPAWLAQLSAAELRQWITDLLYGREVDIPGALTDEPEDLLLDAYQAASADLRSALAAAVQALLEDMAWRSDSPWRAEPSGFSPGDRLVWVARGMAHPGDVGFTKPVKHMAESQDFVGKPGELRGGLHARLLQALIALREPETEAFWREQVRISPRDFLIVSMRGLAEAPTGNPFRLLSEFRGPWTDDMTADLGRLVDALRIARGLETLRAWVWSYMTALPAAVASELAALLPAAPRRPWGARLSPVCLDAALAERKKAA